MPELRVNSGTPFHSRIGYSNAKLSGSFFREPAFRGVDGALIRKVDRRSRRGDEETDGPVLQGAMAARASNGPLQDDERLQGATKAGNSEALLT
jgi:hypothetical protein